MTHKAQDLDLGYFTSSKMSLMSQLTKMGIYCAVSAVGMSKQNVYTSLVVVDVNRFDLFHTFSWPRLRGSNCIEPFC